MSQPTGMDGLWLDGGSSRLQPARLIFAGDEVLLNLDGETLLRVPLTGLSISPKIGSTPRQIRFPDHPGVFESRDHSASQWLDEQIGHRGSRLIARIEGNLLMALGCTALIALLSAAYFVWGIPAGAELLANRLPEDSLDSASQQTLEFLNDHFLSPSELPQERQQAIRDLLATHVPDYDLAQLHFAASEDLGANAMALPDGTIVVTDDLVTLSDSNIEVLGVLAHELGHVAHQHGMRQILQQSGIAITIAMIGGDSSVLGDIIFTLPAVFTQLSYSRRFELEADHYALEFLHQRNLDTQALDRLLIKLHNSRGDCLDDAEDDTDDGKPGADIGADAADMADAELGAAEPQRTTQDNDRDPSSDCHESPNWSRYLSTHPHLEERIEALNMARQALPEH